MILPDPLEFAETLARSASFADACEAHGLAADLTHPEIAGLAEDAVSYGRARDDGRKPVTVLCDHCTDALAVVFVTLDDRTDWVTDVDAASVPAGWHVARVTWGDPAHPTGDVLEVTCAACMAGAMGPAAVTP